ncbi:MAG: aldo/keto reductase [Rhodobacteraceae bacterium]|jgi:aryl-alcohol dehydrogenase-like predicted oxidoreductase|nr:aldo/keto reductase [Paracoccaceae bacterium]
MDYVTLGRTGLRISRVVLGCMGFGSPAWAAWVKGEAEAAAVIDRALDLGINTFDLADVYSLGASEEIVGRLLAARRARHRLVIATKLFNPMSDDPNDCGLSRKHVFDAIDASLRRLGTDHVDLWQIHRFDRVTPLEETLDALDAVVRAGKVRYLGASSMFAWQFMKALGMQRAARLAPFVSMQPHYNLIYREEEREMLPLCRSEGIGVIPWSPLARGRLTRPADAPPATLRAGTDTTQARLYDASAAQDGAVIAALAQVAKARSVPMAQVAYSWLAARPGVTAPIVGAVRPEFLDDAVAGVALALDSAEVAALEAPYRPKPVAGHE